MYCLINTPSGEMLQGPEDTADRADPADRSGPRCIPSTNVWTGHSSRWRPPFLCSQPLVVKLESR